MRIIRDRIPTFGISEGRDQHAARGRPDGGVYGNGTDDDALIDDHDRKRDGRRIACGVADGFRDRVGTLARYV